MSFRCLLYLLLFYIAGPLNASDNDARQVFKRLVLAIGNTGVPKPVFNIIKNDNLVAKTFPSGEVFMGSRFIKYCSGFGADSLNAIASVLSHELVHYYQRHFWAQNFGSAYVDSEWGRKISDDENNKKYLELYETQADQLGFYYAFSAGYKTWKVAAPLLDSIYQWYHLNQNLTGYPSLSQRKLIAQTSASKIGSLIPVFEMSNWLKVISNAYLGDQQSTLLDFSAFGYDHIISSNIQTPEMYNNIAVSKILQAQKYTSSIFSELQLPLIIDQSSLLYETSGTKGDIEKEKFTTLMNEALENLDMALKLNNNYWPASVNKSLILLGLEKYGSCDDELNSQAIKEGIKSFEPLHTTVLEIRAIMYYFKTEFDKSNQYFGMAKKEGSTSSWLNQTILQENHYPELGATSPPDNVIDTSEKWNGRFVGKSLKKHKMSTNHVIGYNNTKADLLLDSAQGYSIFELRQKIGYCPIQYVKVAVNTLKETKSSKGLKIGQTEKEVNTKYGLPNKKIIGTLYTYWLYPKHNLIISIDNSTSMVLNWCYYTLD